MRSLVWASLRTRWPSFVAAFLTLTAAATLITACGMLFDTGLRGHVATERYAGSPLVVAADQSWHYTKSNGKLKSKPLTDHAWLDASILARVRAAPGGRGAVGELTFPASLVRPDGAVLAGPHGGASLGHGWASWALTPFSLRAGHAPDSASQVVLDRGLAARAGAGIGATVTIQTSHGRTPLTVVGVTRQRLSDQSAIFFSDPLARRLAGHPGQLFAIGLPHSRAGDAAGLRDALTESSGHVFAGSGRATIEFSGAARTVASLVSLSSVLGGTAVLVALLVASGTFALSIVQRSRELALLRAIAATPRQVRRMVGWEALIVGVVAAAIGSIVGLPVATWLRSRFVAFGAIPPNMRLQVGPVPALVAVAITVLSAWLSARVSARRAARINPAQALVEGTIEPARLGLARLAAGALAIAGFVVLLFVLTMLHTQAASIPVTLVSVVLAATAVALLGPLLARGVMTVLAGPMRLIAPRTGYLATANNRSNARRLASVITPLTLAVAFACTILFTPSTVSHAAEKQRSDGLRADAVLTAVGPGVPDEIIAAARHVHGVSTVTAELHGTVRLGQDKYPATGITPEGLTRTIDPGVESGSLAHMRDDDIALSSLAARHRHAHLGDRLNVRLGDGTTARLTLIGTYTRGLGFGDVLLPVSVLAAHVDTPLADDLLVTGAAPTALGQAVGRFPGVRVGSPAQYRAALASTRDTSTDVNYLVMGLILAFCAIAIINTLAMATAPHPDPLSYAYLAAAALALAWVASALPCRATLARHPSESSTTGNDPVRDFPTREHFPVP